MMSTQTHINVRNNVQHSIPEAPHSFTEPESQSPSTSPSSSMVETTFTQHHHDQPNEPFTTGTTTVKEEPTIKPSSSSSPMSQAWILGATDDFSPLPPLNLTSITNTTSSTSAPTTPTNNGTATPTPKKPARRIKSLNNTKSEGFISLPPFPSPSHPKTPPSLPPTSLPPTTNPYQTRLLNQPSTVVESILRTACTTLSFDLAEVWLRTGKKTHQLVNSYLRPSALEESVRNELVDVYYGEKSATRVHRLSPVLCKKAKEARDVVWVTSDTEKGVDALRVSISDVRTAVAVPVCHEGSQTNVTFIYFSLKRAIMKSPAVEFLVHMSLAAAVSSVNSIANDIFAGQHSIRRISRSGGSSSKENSPTDVTVVHNNHNPPPEASLPREPSLTVDHLGLKWSSLRNVEYLTDGGNSWIHTAVLNGKPVVVKTLKPECQDLAVAINEIEAEYEIHSRLNHPNIVSLMGAGTTSKGVRFVVMERLDGGTMSQVLGYETRVRDRRRRFWKRKHFSHSEVLAHARALADALGYCHGRAIKGCMCLHRDLKPDNIGFTLDGTLKIIDFGLARILENSSPTSDEVYQMSGETGSLRYMAPEVAESRPYNHKADVYSFGIILWELISCRKPYDGMNRCRFYREVVHNNVRPPLNKKWPKELCHLISECWSADIEVRPSFDDIVLRLDGMLQTVKGAEKRRPKVLKMIDRHSMWF